MTMRSRAAQFAAWAALLVQGCSGGVELNPFFNDPLVEAPVRSIDVVGISGATCEQILSRDHDEPGPNEVIRGRRTTRYPVDPDLDVFDGFPVDEAIALDVVALDDSLLQVARACAVVRLGDTDRVDIELRTLPACETPPTGLDIMLVMDTSLGVTIADPDDDRIEGLTTFILEPGGIRSAVTWGVVTFGHDDRATELVAATKDLDAIRTAVVGLPPLSAGTTRLFDGIAKGGELLRARALCGRRPVMLVVTGFADSGSQRRFEDAGIAIFATRGDVEDDIFTYGIALTDAGFADLNDLISEDLGVAAGAKVGPQIRAAFEGARIAFNQLIE